MPKENHTFRPVTYLLPSDSIIYQAIVDKLIMHKKDKFSNQVYSNIINKIDNTEVFTNPIRKWLEMRENIRKQYRKGNNFYFFSDISGYFENIKIDNLLSMLCFHTGKNEKEYEVLLKKVLVKWQFAKSQGLVQPHSASSILSKIYLTPVDAMLSDMKNKYSRYVDEFYLITNSEKELKLKIYYLCEKLRELGLNLNSSKSRYLSGEEISDELDEDQDYFNLVNYTEFHLFDIELSQSIVDNKFDEFINNYEDNKKVNMKIFRNCIRKYAKKENPRAVYFCLSIINKNYEQIVDIVKYLSVFLKYEDFSKIILEKITCYIKNKDINHYQWVQCWLLNLFIKTDYNYHVDTELLKSIFENKNQSNLSRATALLAYSKHSKDINLVFLSAMYKEADNTLLKRAILAASSKMPCTYTEDMYKIDADDELDIIVLKEYLLKNEYKIEMRI